MFNLIEKLRQKSEKAKKIIAFATALSVAGMIFVMWLLVVYPSFGRDQQKDDAVAKLEPSPLGTIGETFKAGISSIGEQFTKLKESVSSVASSLTQNTAFYSTTTNQSANVSSATPIFIEATTSTPDESGADISGGNTENVSTTTGGF